MKHGSLFSGIGGFDLAAESMGWENVFHCEWMPFPRKVLSHYWPQATSYHDITTTDFTVHRGQIDILTGGFPCQPYSAAGKRKGKDDDRHLWPHMLRCIREVRPRWVVGENVFGLVTWNAGMVFEEVCADLESEGYSVQPFVLPAAAVNAPHRRDRVWFVAYHDGKLYGDTEQQESRHDASIQGVTSERTTSDATDTDNRKQSRTADDRRTNEQRRDTAVWIESSGFSDYGDAADAAGQLRRCKSHHDSRATGLSRFPTSFDASCEQWHASDASATRLQGPNECKKRIGDITRHCEANGWQDFPTVAPICSGNDGLPNGLDGITFPKWRAESIKGYGNAIVPQVAMQIFRAIEAYEQK